MEEPTIPKCENILRLSIQQRHYFVESFDLVLINCDGVIWYMTDQVPDAGKAISTLKGNGKEVKYLTNISLYKDEEYIEKFQAIGVHGVKSEEIIHPVKSLTRFLNANYANAKIFSLCSSRVNDVLMSRGISLVAMDPPTDVKERDLFDVVRTVEVMDCVIYDLNLNLTYCQLAKAHQYLQDQKCSLIVGASNHLLPLRKRCATIGTVGFINILNATTGKSPIVVGKPGAFHTTDVIDQFRIADSSRVLYIGESLKDDVHFGKASGFQTLLVMTGTTNPDDLGPCPDLERPDFICHSIADFIKFFAMHTRE